MKTRSTFAGLGALAFGILTFVAFSLANPPGGNYSDKDITDFLAKGHRPMVFLSIYLMVIGTIGLVLLLARLRDAIEGPRARLFAAFGVAGAAAWLAGYTLAASVPLAYAFGGSGHLSLTNSIVYTISESGWAVMYGAGGVLIGVALVTFALGPVAAPAWLRWATLVAGVCGIAALAWFPFFLVYLWAIVIGLWLLVADRVPAPAAQPA